MNNNTILTELEGSIATMYLNRAHKKNAMTLNMWKQIPEQVAMLEKDKNVKVIIIKGIDESAFSAGADIAEFKKERWNESQSDYYDQFITLAGDSLERCTKPVLALIEGACIGGGAEIALSCDMRFSSTTCKYGITPAKIGLIYGVPQTKRLINAVGLSRAKDILFSGRLLSADEAYKIGLVDHLYEDQSIVEKTYEYAKLLTRRSQDSIKATKLISHAIIEGAKTNEDISNSSLFFSTDIHEGINSFIDKRTPNFDKEK